MWFIWCKLEQDVDAVCNQWHDHNVCILVVETLNACSEMNFHLHGSLAHFWNSQRNSTHLIRMHARCTHTHTPPWTATSKTMDQLSLSSMSELVSEQTDSVGADPQTMSQSASHQRWYTDKPSQWMDLGGKWSCIRSHSLFLQRSMPTGTRIATCRLTRAGAASWVDFTHNQSTLTAACSCCACRNIPQWCHAVIYQRQARCLHAVLWFLNTAVAAWAASPTVF